MAIYQLLQKSTFGPEDVKCMSDAYERALILLGLNNRRDDLLTETVAQYIIENAQTGEMNADLICARTLERLGWRPASRSPAHLSAASAATSD